MSVPFEMNRAEINRENAQHSTGPKTEEGKRKSSLNALRHGLTGQIVVMPSEDIEAYQHHVKSFTERYQPKTTVESNLAQFLADTAWRLHRIAALETNLLSLGVTRPTAFIADAPQQIEDALAIAAALESQSRTLSSFSLYSQRLSRQFEKTETQLRALQQIRREQETQAMNETLDLIELAQSKGESYDPSTDGFVFSKEQIASAQRLRDRDLRARKAFDHRIMAAAARRS
jgi:hypothetical protein